MRPVYVMLSMIVLLGVVGLAEASFDDSGPYECQSRENAVGRGSNFVAMAKMNAITSWIEKQQAADPSFSSWHHAQEKKLFCATRRGTHYKRCIALAQPCRPRMAGQNAAADPSASMDMFGPTH